MKEMGLGYKQFDDIVRQLIPDFGLFEMMDHVGHNTMYNAIMNYSRMDSDKKKYELLLSELRKSNLVSGNLFYDLETEIKTITKETELAIVDKLKKIANKYLIKYSEEYQINLFNLKKGIEELSGIIL
jgi:3-hydroxyacyl-CoA dehydrogenase